jgi:hypothetical protein
MMGDGGEEGKSRHASRMWPGVEKPRMSAFADRRERSYLVTEEYWSN